MEKSVSWQRSESKITHARDFILQQIFRGSYGLGHKIPTEADLTKNLGISRSTIREAVSSLVQDRILERRQGSGTFVIGTQLSSDKNKLTRMKVVRVGVVVQNQHQASPTPYIFGVTKGLAETVPGFPPFDIRFLVSDPNYRGVGMLYYLDAVEAKTVDALVFMVGELVPSEFSSVVETSLPVLFVGDEYKYGKFPCVRPDLTEGVAQMVQFLYHTKRERIGLLLGKSRGRAAESFLAGFVTGHNRIGHEPDLGRVAYMEGDMGLIFQAGEKLLEKNANAIVCLDDDVAVQLIRFLMRRGVRVPEDVVVTGTNDTADSKNTDYPSLTTLRIPHKEMGKAVRDYIFDGIRVGKIPPRTIIFEPELVIRQSAPK